jgi:hypothetical protein
MFGKAQGDGDVGERPALAHHRSTVLSVAEVDLLSLATWQRPVYSSGPSSRCAGACVLTVLKEVPVDGVFFLLPLDPGLTGGDSDENHRTPSEGNAAMGWNSKDVYRR